MRTALATLASRLGSWLNARFNLVSDDPWYDWADQRLDGDIHLSFSDWLIERSRKED